MTLKATKPRTLRQRHQTGQAMVEFMLVVIFLFILFTSILQMIMMMHAYTTLGDAAKEGVRYAIVHGTGNTGCSGPGTTGPPAVTCPDSPGNNVKAAVRNFAGLSFQTVTNSNITVDYNPNSANGANPCNVAGCIVRVTVSYSYQPFFGLRWPRINMNAAADGRIMN